jgi:hypothetical protein
MIDRRELPEIWPGELRRSTALAIELRSNPIAKTLVEGLIINKATDSMQGFADPIALRYVREALGDEGVERYKSAAMNVPSEILEIANGAGWKMSPLTCALTLGADRKDPSDPAAHLRLCSDSILRGIAGVGPRFIVVSMPPRYGKSMLISRRTPAWFLSNWPHLHVGVCGYGDDFASGWGRMVRNDIMDGGPERFGFGIADDSSAAAQWHTTLGGSMWTAGVGGSVTGKGADLLVIDDPVKNMDEAMSLTQRDRVWNWWTSTARTRLHRGAVCIVVMTRWHSDDLAGRILAGYGDTDAREWLEIKLPAIWEKDEPDLLGRKRGNLLWPQRFDAEEVDKTKRSVGAETWSSLYMQQPVDETAFGKVYHAFEEHANVREVYRDERLPILVSLDFNVDPGSACICQWRETFAPMAHLTNEIFRECEVLDEISLPNSNTQMMADELHQRLRQIAGGRKIKVLVYGDASGSARRSSATRSDWEIIEDSFQLNASAYSASFHVGSDNPLVKDRCAAVNAMLRTAGKDVRLYIDPRCRQLIADFKQCRWKRDSNGNATTQIDKSDKNRSHMSDALGYLIYGRRMGAAAYGEQQGWAR